MCKIKYILTLLTFLSIANVCSAQEGFYFKKWKSKQKFTEKIVVFQIDTAMTDKEVQPYLLAIDRTMSNLEPLGFSCKIIPYPADTIISQEVLMLRFEKLPNAYVKLDSSPEIPACYRMKVTQPNSTAKNKVETNISISIPDFRKGLEQFAEAFAEQLTAHFLMKGE